MKGERNGKEPLPLRGIGRAKPYRTLTLFATGRSLRLLQDARKRADDIPPPPELHPRSWTKKEINYECSSKESHRVI